MMTEGFGVGPAVDEAWSFEDFASIREELDEITGDDVSAGPLGFGDLLFQLRWEPHIVIVEEGDPLSVRAFDAGVAGGRNIA